MAKLRIPNLEYVRRAKHEYAIEQQRKSEQLIIKGYFNQPIYVNRNNGMYQFQSSTKGKFILLVSDLASDWPELETKSLTESYVRQWSVYAVKWLENHGYSPVEIRITRGYLKPGQNFTVDTQHDIRQKITAAFLSEGMTNRKYFSNSADVIGSKG